MTISAHSFYRDVNFLLSNIDFYKYQWYKSNHVGAFLTELDSQYNLS